jgi:hypothetical protein
MFHAPGSASGPWSQAKRLVLTGLMCRRGVLGPCAHPSAAEAQGAPLFSP